MGYLVFAIAVVAVSVALDQLALWAERRGWMYWRKSEGGRDAGGGVFGVMDNLFDPAKRHLLEEREHKQLMRVDINASGGALDLESRTVYLTGAPSVEHRPSAVRDAPADRDPAR